MKMEVNFYVGGKSLPSSLVSVLGEDPCNHNIQHHKENHQSNRGSKDKQCIIHAVATSLRLR